MRAATMTPSAMTTKQARRMVDRYGAVRIARLARTLIDAADDATAAWAQERIAVLVRRFPKRRRLELQSAAERHRLLAHLTGDPETDRYVVECAVNSAARELGLAVARAPRPLGRSGG